MMRAIYLFAVVSLAAVAHATGTLPSDVKSIITTEGKQYELYKEMLQLVNLPEGAKHDLYRGLDIERTNPKVTKADLKLYYWHDDIKYAVDKFVAKINDDANKDTLEEAEFDNDLQKKEIQVALIECSYLKSPGMRQSCYADELLTYAALVMKSDHITKFYQDLDKDNNGLTVPEILEIPHKHKNKDNKQIAEELGGYFGAEKNKVTKEELEEYMIQESIVDDFRECRHGKNGEFTYEKECLYQEVVEYVNDDLTEIDIALLFRAINTNHADHKITKEEMKAFTGVHDDAQLKTIMDLIDMSATTPKNSDPLIEYAEFRSYLRSPTVLIQLERYCAMEFEKQDQEIECMYKTLKQLLIDGHDPIWMEVWDLDQTITFEILDADQDDGKIKESDLQKVAKFTKSAIPRFLKEANIDKDDFVCLEEFGEYMDIPHMVYGTGECLLHTRTRATERGDCFCTETSEVVDNFKFIEETAFNDWFKYYDKDNDKKIEERDDNLKQILGGDQDLTIMFLEELGQGGMTVEPFEFNWYVKQQDLAHSYEDDKIVTSEKTNFNDGEIKKLHEVLIKYINDEMTERDIEDFFKELDKHKDHELQQNDFQPNVWKVVQSLITKIDALMPEGDADHTVNFIEFWAWLNHAKDPAKPKELIKHIFEKACTQTFKKQSEEIKCYVDTFNKNELF